MLTLQFCGIFMPSAISWPNMAAKFLSQKQMVEKIKHCYIPNAWCFSYTYTRLVTIAVRIAEMMHKESFSLGARSTNVMLLPPRWNYTFKGLWILTFIYAWKCLVSTLVGLILKGVGVSSFWVHPIMPAPKVQNKQITWKRWFSWETPKPVPPKLKHGYYMNALKTPLLFL